MGAITRGFANNILSGGTIDATDGLSGTVSASNITDSSISSVTAFPAAAGDFIQSTASDPSPATIGDVWYNNATYAFKVASVTTTGTWAAGGNLGTARYMMGSAIQGTQTASLAFGGNPYTGVTESYNGTSWSPVSSLNTPRGRLAGAGTQTAALGFGGLTPLSSATESWGGSSWTSVNSLNRAVRNNAGIGTQTAAVSFGGVDNSDNTTHTENWNGTSWTTSGNFPFATTSGAGAGTQTAGLAFGGIPPNAGLAATEEWNGAAVATKTITTS